MRRTVRASVERTGLPAGEERLRRLVAAPAPDGAAGPLDEVTPAGRLILAVLRGRLEGATADRVAADSGLSPSHTRRCLRGLRRMEFAECDDTASAWGYRQRRVRFWRLAMSERTLAALPLVGWHTPPEERSPETVPPEFWYLFWSGQDASTLTVADHAVHIADTLIGGFDRAARHWALQHLPLDALRTLRTMRGYTTGRLADRIGHAIERRAGE